MAKLDWETSRDQLDAAILAVPLAAAELVVTQGVIDRFEEVGVPYNAVYTGSVDTNKAVDEAANTVTFSEWEASTLAVHDDAMKSILYGEDLAGAQGTTIVFNSDVAESKQNLSAMITRITSLVGKVDESTIAVLIDYRGELTTAYGARPKEVFTGEYGVIRSVNVSVDETLTIQEAEVVLQEQIDKTAALLSELSFVP